MLRQAQTLLLLCLALVGALAILLIVLDSGGRDVGSEPLRAAADMVADPRLSVVFAVLFLAGVALVMQARTIWSAVALLPLLGLSIAPVLVGSVEEVAVPSGAIVAFEQRFLQGEEVLACPPGWSLAKGLEGRFLLGAGQGESLSPRHTGDHGGSENVALSVPQLPQHSHVYSDIYLAEIEGGIGLPSKHGSKGGIDHDNGGYAINRTSGDTGSGAPHENMPPFRVVQFCVRN